jgi:hypothetical protein
MSRAFASVTVMALLAAMTFAQATNPRFGRWKLKSETQTNIMTYEPFNGTGMKVTVETTNADGNKSSWGYTTMFDGKEYPVTGRSGTDTAIVRIVTPKINEIVYKQGDRVVQLLVNVLSADNQTIEVSYFADGRAETHATYEKQK